MNETQMLPQGGPAARVFSLLVAYPLSACWVGLLGMASLLCALLGL